MNSPLIPPTNSSDSHGDDKINVLDLALVLLRHKRLLIALPLAAAILSAALSFALPKMYKASVTMLPPQQSQSTASALLSQFGSMAGMAAGVAGLKNPNDLYVGMLRSRTVADRLIERFGLKKLYEVESEVDSLEKARERLKDDTVVTSGKDGLIEIEVQSKDQALVAKLTNGYVEELAALTGKLAVTEASQRRVFFERQLEKSKDNLAKAEIALKRAMESNGVISVDTESRGILETGARLKAQISAKEIQLNSMKAFVTNSHPEYRRAEEELDSLRSELSRLENGRSGAVGAARKEDGIAQSGLDNIQLLRDVKYYQMLYELLAKQYEVARLDEAKDPAVVQVLDPAMTPARKFKPKRLILVLASTLAGLFLSIVLAFVFEIKRKVLRSPEGAAQWNELKSQLRSTRS
jgi:uncharacterized protein involved in exopolysaccharide biosynthesis